MSDILDIDFPLFAFSHCRDVVVAVSKAGGFGVLGAVGFSPEQLDVELQWIDENIDGHPYGVDIVIPENMDAHDLRRQTLGSILAAVPEEQRAFAARIMADHDVRPETMEERAWLEEEYSLMPDTGERTMDVAFSHPIAFVAHALGVPPPSLVARAKRHGIPVGALVGSKDHALRQVAAGVDIIIAQGTEAGGHCGEVSTMVLVPEILAAFEGLGQHVPVLAAGGIVTGRQMAACMTMGASGVWTGSVWLPTIESELTTAMREKLIRADSRDTVRTRARTGKMCRMLRSDWTDAWEAPGAPKPLPMPFQPILTESIMRPALKAADKGDPKAYALINHLVGQGVGMMTEIKSSRTVVQEFMVDFADAVERIQRLAAE